MALGEKRNGSIFAADAERRDAPEYQVTSEPEVVPVVVDDTPNRTLNTDVGALGRAHNLFFAPETAGKDMDYVRKQPLFNSQYRRWKFIAVCSAVDDDVKARYDSQKSKGKKGLVAEIDNYEVYALTWDDVFQSFDLRHAFLLDKLKMDEEAIAAEIAQTAGDEKSKDTADALTALVAN